MSGRSFGRWLVVLLGATGLAPGCSLNPQPEPPGATADKGYGSGGTIVTGTGGSSSSAGGDTGELGTGGSSQAADGGAVPLAADASADAPNGGDAEDGPAEPDAAADADADH